jgi:hypothetical protein
MIREDYEAFLVSPMGKELITVFQDEINILANQLHIAVEGGISPEKRELVNQTAHTLRSLKVLKEKLLSGELFGLPREEDHGK